MANETIVFINGYDDTGFTESALSSVTSMYLIRTTSDGTDGYIRMNGKNYCKGQGKQKYLQTTTGQTLTEAERQQALRNIGWVNQTNNITISGLPSGETATVTVKCDGDTFVLSGDTQYTVDTYMYCPYEIEAEDKAGYVTPQKITGESGRGCTISHVLTYLQEE